MKNHESLPNQDNMQNPCQRSILNTVADMWQNLTTKIYGLNNKDTLALAELSLSGSINELTTAETRLNNDLKELVLKVRQLDPKKQRATLNDNLMKSRSIRTSLAN